jgi:class 3 adenylate cyclase
MSSEPASSQQLDTAHVLFMDIVGYSDLHRQSMEGQRRLLEELQELVRRTLGLQRAETESDLIRLPTGDGMALVFFRDPVAPAQCAIEIARALRSRPHLKLRMGLHSGPVYRVEDINGRINVSGSGINLAQRVMDCGDAGHILLSGEIVGYLRQVSAWPVHDLGECEVKHGERLRLFNLYTDEYGNPGLPTRLYPGSTAAAGAVPRTSATAQVAILYKRDAQPDEEVLKLLETGLRAHGYRVFVDRHLAVGVEWAREIERQVQGSDAVIPLLSATSIQSEMLAWEVQTAHDAAQQTGKPRLLPVWVNQAEPLPPPLAGILGPLEYALWKGPGDDEQVLSRLLDALRNPAGPARERPRPKLEPVGGAVPLDSRFYVVRPTDEEFRAAIALQDSIVLLKGARQMGKTSLLARGLQQAREAGARVVFTDFQKLNNAQLESLEGFFLTLAEALADQLDLDVLPEEIWSARRGPNVNFERYLRREVLAMVDAPVVWGLDEVDRLFTCSFASEVFGLFRSWHNERSLDPTGPWSRLTLAIAYATEAHLFITDLNQSPFNVGTRLVLEDFTFEQVADLNRRYGCPLANDAETARFFRLVGGQPYLSRRGLHEMVTRGLDIAAFEAQADREDGIFGDHLRRILVLLAREPELCEVVRGALRGRPCPTPESFYRLRSAGVMAGESARDVRPRCRLYETYLTRHLL